MACPHPPPVLMEGHYYSLFVGGTFFYNEGHFFFKISRFLINIDFFWYVV